MATNSSRFLKVGARAAAVLGGLTLASCAPQYSAPREVQTSDPSVTYTYSTDQGLLQVDQSAASYCSRYQSVAKAASFTTDQSGSKVVVFQCVPATTTTAAMAPPPNPNLTYSYESDQQLMDDQRNAQSYCASTGSPQVTSNIVTNPDGARTVTFQCAPQ
jgi:hypothetical protein